MIAGGIIYLHGGKNVARGSTGQLFRKHDLYENKALKTVGFIPLCINFFQLDFTARVWSGRL